MGCGLGLKSKRRRESLVGLFGWNPEDVFRIGILWISNESVGRNSAGIDNSAIEGVEDKAGAIRNRGAECFDCEGGFFEGRDVEGVAVGVLHFGARDDADGQKGFLVVGADEMSFFSGMPFRGFCALADFALLGGVGRTLGDESVRGCRGCVF